MCRQVCHATAVVAGPPFRQLCRRFGGNDLEVLVPPIVRVFALVICTPQMPDQFCRAAIPAAGGQRKKASDTKRIVWSARPGGQEHKWRLELRKRNGWRTHHFPAQRNRTRRTGWCLPLCHRTGCCTAPTRPPQRSTGSCTTADLSVSAGQHELQTRVD